MAAAKYPFRVRKQTSGWTAFDKFIVVMLKEGQAPGRVSVHSYSTREAAQHAADDLNVDYLMSQSPEDSRSYDERSHDARAEYVADTSVGRSKGRALSGKVPLAWDNATT